MTEVELSVLSARVVGVNRVEVEVASTLVVCVGWPRLAVLGVGGRWWAAARVNSECLDVQAQARPAPEVHPGRGFPGWVLLQRACLKRL